MKKRPLLICTDPGIDDVLALCALFGREEFEFAGIVALNGNVKLERTVQNALGVAELCGCADIPVIAGAGKPLSRPAVNAESVHGASGLGSTWLHPKGEPLAVDAVDFIRAQAEKYAGALTILSLGPLTDIARTLQSNLHVAGLIREIVLMGGALDGGNATPFAEFNIYADPEAAACVFNAGISTVMIGLDVTHRWVFAEPRVAALRHDSPLGRMIETVITDYIAMYRNLGKFDGAVIHDAMAALYLLHPESFRTLRCDIEVDTADGPSLGQTRSAGQGLKTVHATLDVDVPTIEACFIESIQKLYERG